MYGSVEKEGKGKKLHFSHLDSIPIGNGRKMKGRELDEETPSHLKQNRSFQYLKEVERKHINLSSLSFPFLSQIVSKHSVNPKPWIECGIIRKY